MASPAGQPVVVRFGAFELDARRGELRKGGIPLKIHPQPFRTLLLLTERSGEIVTREEIQNCLWGNNTFVDFDRGINFCINQIRSVLADDAENPRYIETVPRRGYRFMVSGIPVAAGNESTAFVPGAASSRAASIHEPKMAAAGTVEFPFRPDLHIVPQLVPRNDESRATRKDGLRRIAVLTAIAILTAGGFWYFHPSAKLTEKDTVVLADFNNTTGESVFDDALKQALAVDLAQSPFLNILSEQRAEDELKLMGQAPGAQVTPKIARELCQRAGSKAYFRGSIAKLGSEYVIGLSAVNCQTGDSLAQEQATANSKEQVLQALGAAATTLRKKVGESLATVQEFGTPIEQATTPSLDALEAYTLGRKAMMRQDDPASAVTLFQRAIGLDPNFAMAYASLGTAYGKLEEDELSAQSTTKAYELRERVSEREKFYIEAHYHQNATGDLNQARKTYELWALTYPHDGVPPANLGAIYRVLGEPEKRLEENLEAHRLEPEDGGVYYGIVDSYLALDRFQEARTTGEEARARNVESANLHRTMYKLAFVEGDTRGMAEQVAWATGKPRVEDQFLASEAQTEEYFGHMEKAREYTRRAVESAKHQVEAEVAEGYQSSLSLAEEEMGNFALARRGLATTSPTHADFMIGLILARTGDSARAEKRADDLAKEFPLDTVVNSTGVPLIRAAIEMNRRNPSKAIESLRIPSAYELGEDDELYSAYLRGVAYLQLQQGSEAVNEFQRILNHRGLVRNFCIGALAHLQIARAYALEGDTAKAGSAYQDFLTLWRDADPDIPILKEAKIEYAKLK